MTTHRQHILRTGLHLRIEPDPQPLVPQDTTRRVLFGQASDPLYPPHPGEAEIPESDLTRCALEDRPRPAARPRISPMLRGLALVGIATVALALLFLRSAR